MVIEREDLAAAAAVGTLDPRQIDPLMVFLLQRDVKLRRQTMLKRMSRMQVNAVHIAYYIGGIIAIGLGASLVATYTALAFDSIGIPALLCFTLLYAMGTIAMAIWFEKHDFAIATRIFTTSVIAMVPLAVFAAQQMWA